NVLNIEMSTDFFIGLKDQPDEHRLWRPLGVRTDIDSNVYIADVRSLRIKKFDSDGNFIQTIGRRGLIPVPGEFVNLLLMDVTPESLVVALDPDGHGYSLFSRSGEYIESHPYDI